MIRTTVTHAINIDQPHIIAQIQKMSPCPGLITLIKRIIPLMKVEMPQHANLKAARAIAEEAISKGLVLIVPSYALYQHLINKTPYRCHTVKEMCKMAIEFCETEGLGRPTLKELHTICSAMIEHGHTTLKPDTSSAANAFLTQILTQKNNPTYNDLQGRVFEDYVDACEAFSALAEAATDQFPDTRHMRVVISTLHHLDVIKITDSAMSAWDLELADEAQADGT